MASLTARHVIGAPEAADRLGISVRTLDRMEKDGRLKPASRIGGRRKYRVTDVDRLLATGDSVRVASPPRR